MIPFKLPPAIKKSLLAFAKKYGYTRFVIDPDGELTFYQGTEPFGKTEYVRSSRCRKEWEALQKKVDGLAK
jgi:hypothetical protein